MVWTALVHDATGELASVATVVARPAALLAAGLRAVPLVREPDWNTDVWDPALEQLVARPAPPPPIDRVDDILGDTDLAALRAADRTSLRTVLERHLADPAVRYRGA